MTHAFFKALLFLGSGSVIHGMHDEQDMQKMGGLKKYMPSTYKTYLIGSLAISPVSSRSAASSRRMRSCMHGLSMATRSSGLSVSLAAFCTAFYMFRSVFLTFDGKSGSTIIMSIRTSLRPR